MIPDTKSSDPERLPPASLVTLPGENRIVPDDGNLTGGFPVNEQSRSRITIELGKRGGRPCIRGMRITVYDVLCYLAAGMSVAEVLDGFHYLTPEDIQASLALAAERERSILVSAEE
jgi:uncharacterized protein (DUF433 family)